jgi:hypothetical protein
MLGLAAVCDTNRSNGNVTVTFGSCLELLLLDSTAVMDSDERAESKGESKEDFDHAKSIAESKDSDEDIVAKVLLC